MLILPNLSNIIDTTQGFLKGRPLHNNVHLVLDLMEHEFIFESLKRLGFQEKESQISSPCRHKFALQDAASEGRDVASHLSFSS